MWSEQFCWNNFSIKIGLLKNVKAIQLSACLVATNRKDTSAMKHCQIVLKCKILKVGGFFPINMERSFQRAPKDALDKELETRRDWRPEEASKRMISAPLYFCSSCRPGPHLAKRFKKWVVYHVWIKYVWIWSQRWQLVPSLKTAWRRGHSIGVHSTTSDSLIPYSTPIFINCGPSHDIHILPAHGFTSSWWSICISREMLGEIRSLKL